MFFFRDLKQSFLNHKKVWLLPVLFLILFSCKKTVEDNEGYSNHFKAIYDTVTRLNDQKKPSEGLRYLDSAFSKIKKPTIADYFRAYGLRYLYYHQGSFNLKKELLYADSMLMMAKKNINSKHFADNYAEANFVAGDAYFDQLEYNNAFQCYYKGYFIGRNHLKHDILAEYTYRMAMIMFKQARYIESVSYFKESYRHGLFYKDNFATFYQRQEVLDDIGESFKSNGNLDSASNYFSKAINYINNNGERFKNYSASNDIARAVVYGNQGDIARLQGHYEQARTLLQKSIAINNKKGNDNYNAQLVSINLGKLYIDNKEYSLFISLFNALRRQLDTLKNQEAETDWNMLMSRYYVDKKDPASAFEYLQRFNTLRDSATKRSNSLKETDVIQQQDNYDKQYQINDLQNNNKLQLIYTYMAVCCAIMALVIFLMVYRNWKKSKSDIQVFSTLNKQIVQQKTNLEIALEKLKVRNQEKDRILRTVAHDLRNPIGGIASLTLAMADDDFTADQKELINLIQETSTDSLELINEILEITNNNSTQLNKELVEINSLLSKSVELLRFKAAEKNQEIKLQLLSKTEELLISREKIWRVMSNLISNAIKFSPVGSVIFVSIVDHENEVEIAVKDSGIGIPAKLKNKVFNMFTEAKRPGTAGEKSFGLGLSISKQIIEGHNGRIWFENNDQKGTVFYIRLSKQLKTKAKLSKNQHTSVPTP